LARNDKFARFPTRGQPDRFQSNETTIFLIDDIASSGVDDSHTRLKVGEIHQKKAIWIKILLGIVITTISHHKEDSMVGCKIMSKCIVFGSPVENRYAQSNNITSEQEKSCPFSFD
jgi:hypothetical protein